eukprot:1013246-Rhodomonas_salina.1
MPPAAGSLLPPPIPLCPYAPDTPLDMILRPPIPLLPIDGVRYRGRVACRQGPVLSGLVTGVPPALVDCGLDQVLFYPDLTAQSPEPGCFNRKSGLSRQLLPVSGLSDAYRARRSVLWACYSVRGTDAAYGATPS